jgi:radical SAM protein with 4Fe4S-binding SPASM domain
LDTYYLHNHIHVVKGAKKHCIYDLKKRRLYSINQSGLNMINHFLSPKEKELSMSENTFLKELLDYEILTIENKAFNKAIIKKANITFAWIEVTKSCNLRCIHCYNEAEYHEYSNSIMKFSDFCYAVDMLEDMGVRRIQLIGGEPYVLGDKLSKMLRYIKNKFEFIEIFTNGTLIKDNDIKELIDNNISQVALSLYSNIPSEHDKVTKSMGSYNNLTCTIELLKENEIPFRVANVRMKDIEVGENHIGTLHPKSGYDFVRLSGRANLDLYDKDLLKQKLITKKHFQKKITPKAIEKNMQGHNCFSNRLYIDVDLNVYPCVMERRVKHGNIKEDKLKDIIKHNLIDFTKDQVNECKHCEYRYACHDCRPDSLNGDLREKPWYCTYNPYDGEWYDIDEFINGLGV